MGLVLLLVHELYFLWNKLWEKNTKACTCFEAWIPRTVPRTNEGLLKVWLRAIWEMSRHWFLHYSFCRLYRLLPENNCLKGTKKECLKCGNEFSTDGNLEKHMIFSFACGLIEDCLNSVWRLTNGIGNELLVAPMLYCLWETLWKKSTHACTCLKTLISRTNSRTIEGLFEVWLRTGKGTFKKYWELKTGCWWTVWEGF